MVKKKLKLMMIIEQFNFNLTFSDNEYQVLLATLKLYGPIVTFYIFLLLRGRYLYSSSVYR